jgi:hypothetical protein
MCVEMVDIERIYRKWGRFEVGAGFTGAMPRPAEAGRHTHRTRARHFACNMAA